MNPKFFFIIFGVCIFLASGVYSFTGSGAGSIANPFVITTCVQLNETGQNLTAHYVLGNDIDCVDTINWDSGRGFSPIGTTTSAYFRGTFNGQNFTIRNVYMNRTSQYLGMFGTVQLANISNVRIENGTYWGLSGVEYFGGLAGWTSSGTKINNSYFNGTLRAVGTVGYFGGFAGQGGGDYIINSYSAGTIRGTGFRMGGFVGFIAGSSFVINQSYSLTHVNSTYSSSGVSGGFIGAYNSGQVHNSYARGNVSGTTGSVAGFVSTTTVNINRSYSTGSLSGAASKYGFCGAGACNTVTASFWDNQTAGTTQNGGGTGKTTAEMKTQSTFTDANWDFGSTWAIDPEINDGYPYLIAFSTEDISGPIISIAYPVNARNYSSVSGLNYTASDATGVQACWYSVDSGVTNSSAVSPGTNFTGLSASEGSNTWRVYCNDTLGTMNSASSTFSLDTILPAFVNVTNQSIAYTLPFNYTLNASDASGVSCFSVDDVRFSINCSGYLRNATLLNVGTYALSIGVNDSANNTAFTSMTVNVTDSSVPTTTLHIPADSYSANGSAVFNITFNCSAGDNHNLSSIGLYITNRLNESFSLNQSTSVTGTNASAAWHLNVSSGNYTWNCLSADASGNTKFGVANRSIFLTFADEDDDGIEDDVDYVSGNEDDVTVTGVDLNITIGGASADGNHTGTKSVVFYDNTAPIINFTHNFSVSEIDMSRISIVVSDTYIVVNLSGQVQTAFNKTLYLEDNAFTSLCVKDEEVSSISAMSSDCTGSGETDISSCLGSSESSTYGLITCVDQGSTLAISGLQYSAIRGTPAPSSDDSGGGSSGSVGSERYIREENYNDGILRLRMIIPAGASLSKTIQEDQETGVRKIEVRAKTRISGELHITSEEGSCASTAGSIPYTTLYFEPMFTAGEITEATITLRVSSEWIENEGIARVELIDCSTGARVSLRSAGEHTYTFATSEFSRYALEGYTITSQSGNELDVASDSRVISQWKPNWWVVIVPLTIVVVSVTLFLRYRRRVSLGYTVPYEARVAYEENNRQG